MCSFSGFSTDLKIFQLIPTCTVASTQSATYEYVDCEGNPASITITKTCRVTAENCENASMAAGACALEHAWSDIRNSYNYLMQLCD